MLKSRRGVIVLTAVWVIFVALDGASSLMRVWYVRKMKNPVRFVYGVTRYSRTVLMVLLAISNVFLLLWNFGQQEKK